MLQYFLKSSSSSTPSLIITMTTLISLILETFRKDGGIPLPGLTSCFTFPPSNSDSIHFSLSFLSLHNFAYQRRGWLDTVGGENTWFRQNFLEQLAGSTHLRNESHYKNTKPLKCEDPHLTLSSDTEEREETERFLDCLHKSFNVSSQEQGKKYLWNEMVTATSLNLYPENPGTLLCLD